MRSKWVFLLPFCLLIGAVQVRADEDPGIYIYHWPEWQSGFDAGLMALGHFGRGSSINTPPGSLGFRGQYHYWWDHLLEIHGTFGLGFGGYSYMLGAGVKVNLIEYVEDVSGNIRAKGIQRGLLSKAIPNFAIFGSVDLAHYGYGTPLAGATYNTSITVLQPGLGIQWYFYLRNGFARRFYLETSGAYTVIDGGSYIVPYVGIGCELK
jgi:hypothetical protein